MSTFCDLFYFDLWPLTLTFCMGVTFISVIIPIYTTYTAKNGFTFGFEDLLGPHLATILDDYEIERYLNLAAES